MVTVIAAAATSLAVAFVARWVLTGARDGADLGPGEPAG